MAQLPILFQIQTIESRLQALKKDRDQIQNSPQLAQAETLLRKINSLLNDIGNKRNIIHSSNRNLDFELKSCQEHLTTEEKRLYGGSVTNSRELEQIQQKVGEYQKTIAKLEDEILQLMEQDDALTNQSSGFKKKAEALEREITTFTEETKLKLSEINIEFEGLEMELNGVISQVPQEWLERYQRIAKAHHGIGIAQVKTGNCGACHVSLPDLLLQKVKRGDDAINYCENCGRILYY
jgi:uncharacterized protein